MPSFRKHLEGTRNVIIESNSVVKFLRPDLYLTILNPATEDFKASARRFLDRADAVILHEPSENPAWDSVSLRPVRQRPIFHISPPPYVTPEIVDFVRSQLAMSALKADS